MKQLQRIMVFFLLLFLGACNIVQVPTYTEIEVTFMDENNAILSTQYVAMGSTITIPEDPQLEGYLFDGWYTDSSYTTRFDFTQPLNKNTTIFAKWESEVVLDPYTIGYIGPLTGDLQEIGNDTLQGIELAVNEQANGINGHPLHVVAYDIGSDGTDAMTAYNTLQNTDHLVAIIGGGEYDTLYSVQVAADNDGIPFISTAITQEQDESDTTPAFVVAASEELRMRLSIGFVFSQIAAEHPGFIYNDSGDGWEDTRDQLHAAVSDADFTFSEINPLSDFTDTEWNHVAISSWNFRGVDMVISVGSGVYMSSIFTKAAEMDVDWNYFSMDSWNYNTEEIIDGMYLDEYSTADTTEFIQDFTTNYTTEFEQEPTRYSALGYDSVQIIIEAVRQSNENTSTVQASLENVELTSSTTGFRRFDEHGNAIKEMVIVSITDGETSVYGKYSDVDDNE